MKLFRITTFIPLLAILVMPALHAQRLYRTYAGHLILAGQYKEFPLIVESHGMYMLINYETAELEINLSLETLTVNHDSLNMAIQKIPDKTVTFQGRMQIPYVNTEGHPTQKFPVDGTLTINGLTRPFVFDATLMHLEVDKIACSLTGDFTLHLNSLFPEMLKQGFNNIVYIRFLEIILERTRN